MVDFIYLSIGVSYIFLTGFVIKQNIKSLAHRYFLLFLIGLLLWHATLYFYLFVPLGDWLLLIGRLNYATGPIFSLGLLGFFYTFPSLTFQVSKKTEMFFWGWTIIIVLITALTPFVDKNEVYMDGIGPVVELGEGYYLYLLHVFLLPVITLVIGTKKYLSLKGLAKIKFRYSFWIFVPTMIAFLTSNLILPIFGIIWQFIYSPIFLFPIAFSCAFSMYWYRFFDLPYQSLKILRSSILLVIFSLIGIMSYEMLSWKILPGHPLPNFLISALISLFCMSRIEKLLPEFISSSFREFRYKMDELKSGVYYTKSYTELIQKLEKTFILDLHLSSVQLYLIRSKKNHIDVPIYFKDLFTDEIEKNGIKLLVTEEVVLQKKAILLAHLKKLNAALCVPLYLEKRLIGLLVIGNKAENNIFSQEEIEEILKTKQYIELCFINILLQSDLKEENDYMKEMIDKKTKSLKRQNQKIKKIVNQQSDFIAVTAHEFRTPLNIALLQLEDTLDSYEHSTHVLEDMKTLESSLDKLKHLTQNLFDVQQYDLKKVRVYEKEIDLNWFIADINEEFQDIFRKKNRKLLLQNNLKATCPVSIDEPKLRQVLHNLLTNALKFTAEEGTIMIKAEEKKNTINISVIDNGEGVPEHTKKKIFEKFHTNHSHMGMGIGMGLYLCKRIIDLHKGRIIVEDTKGGGATFIIELPKHPKTKKLHTRTQNASTSRK